MSENAIGPSIAALRRYLNIEGPWDDVKINECGYRASKFVESFVGTYDEVFATYGLIPEPLNQAVSVLARHFFDDGQSEIPDVVWQLIAPYRKWAF